MAKNKVVVDIQFCGGCGYGPKYDRAVELLEKSFPAKDYPNIEYVEQEDPGVTGNFEVKVNGKLLHSKKTQGDGFLHQNQANIEKVIAAIEQEMGGK